jgi:hypothetical protein
MLDWNPVSATARHLSALLLPNLLRLGIEYSSNLTISPDFGEMMTTAINLVEISRPAITGRTGSSPRKTLPR